MIESGEEYAKDGQQEKKYVQFTAESLASVRFEKSSDSAEASAKAGSDRAGCERNLARSQSADITVSQFCRTCLSLTPGSDLLAVSFEFP